MGCGDLTGVFDEDPQDMPGQGLARTDNYRSGVASKQYGDLLGTYLSNENQSKVLAAEQQFKPQWVAQDAATTGQALGGTLDVLGEYLPQIQETERASDPLASRVNELLLQQAFEELMAGSRLTPAQQRAVQQNSRAGMAARGMGGTNAALADELLAQYDLGEQAKAGRRSFAMSALGVNKEVKAGRTPQDWLQLAVGLGRSAGSTLLPNSASAGLLASVFGENQANNRTQAELETKIGMDQADKWSDLLSTVGGAAAGLCWVAREVYGADNPKWLEFRAWLLTTAPGWFRALYRRYGAQVAGWLADKPRIKQLVRRWMDARLAHTA